MTPFNDVMYPIPRLVISRCLELEACRYDGASIRAPWVRRLRPFVELVPVCPEVAIGLGVPRDPVRLVTLGGPADPPRMVQPATGRDLTEAMTGFSRAFLDRLAPVDGFLLKSRSPSCGLGDTKLYSGAGDEEPSGRGAGLFARAVLERFGDLAVTDEERLGDPAARHRFLSELFDHARRRLARDRARQAGRAEATPPGAEPYPRELMDPADSAGGDP